ncbi:hypothetical protein GRI40_06330 [Altererythrobacter aerius]|uniref:GIY-YIG nuclease family protein n=1 Tax=Tsuneonella aeria TaxID=1837929 RepID=A0A6I4TDY0_9SPHN|nr:hypothetical protein [Tsuneonella aeria]MXO74836.1 hypothetical protein [Tsuneonella aeria]
MPKAGKPKLIGGKTLQQWDTEWVRVNGGFRILHPELNHSVGLFRAVRDGQVMVLGQATECANGGLRKRLSDFRRSSWSGRNHTAGWYIYTNRDVLKLEVLVTGSDREAAKVAAALKRPMIALHEPPKTFG